VIMLIIIPLAANRSRRKSLKSENQ
jgi:hypothetical protein